MKPFRLTPHASAHLDWIRSIAALAVMAGHVRTMYCVEYSELQHKNLFLQTVYFFTGFGHQSVVVFFVLSGLLIGPSVLEAVGRGRRSWKQYSVNRLTRLYIVLIPALLLTAALDRSGQGLPGAQLSYRTPLPGYAGWTVTQRTGLPIFVGNVLFLESIRCPPFGSNAPLWSLSFEFWYYLLFPLLALAFAASQSWSRRAIWASLALLVIWFIGSRLIASFPIWLLGALVALFHARRPEPAPWALLRIGGSGAILAAVLTLIRTGHLVTGNQDYILALATALFLGCVLRTDGAFVTRWPGQSYARVAHWLAGFSYTLYLTHLPILIFLRALLITNSRWQPTPLHLLWLFGIALFTIACCFAISLATEARTGQVRKALLPPRGLTADQRS